ncbi:hypothetical protein P9847_15980 [Paenibacillus chibensis]|uniref:DUF4064 domain-containing protein n=1 Tax=Paenibacillus chibensis TaxID=59846 RepID=A0ABU6PV93_9BACL|nr:hypothetical protein [Paenibacillus chibensis]
MGTAVKSKAPSPSKKQIKQQDRLGRAVVSFIFSLIGLIFMFLFFKALSISASNFSNSTGIIVFFFIVYFLNALSFFLGISARRSTSGRGLAIAAITISAIPFAILTIFLVLTAVTMLSVNLIKSS